MAGNPGLFYMSKIHSHISSAVKVLEKYNGSQPLVYYLKNFFSAEKKYGSRDRKSIAALCYAYFRTGHAMRKGNKTEKILAGIFLSENTSSEFLQELRPEWNDRIKLPPAEKLSLLDIREEDIFPFLNELPGEVDKMSFALSFLKQPRLFLRARPGNYAAVLQKLNDAGVPFETQGEDCLSLPNAIKADTLLRINSEVVIQDMNSQQVLNFLTRSRSLLPKNKKADAWDCCAASGGKAILLYDRLKGNVRLTVSDIRETILANLKKRLEESGISINKSFVADLRKANIDVPGKFDIILCDAPCTGSGTWSRNPEQLYYFHRKKIGEYAALQKNIVSNTIPALAAGGLFFYITCSVFKEENEAQVEFIQEKFHMRLLQMEYLKGYDSYADTMFVSVFSK